MLEARKAGANFREIARAFDVSPSTAHSGVTRALRREARRYQEEMGDIPWLFAERYDTLLRELIPFTRSQVLEDPNTGQKTRIPPSYDAIDRVLKVMAAQQRMFGL